MVLMVMGIMVIDGCNCGVGSDEDDGDGWM